MTKNSPLSWTRSYCPPVSSRRIPDAPSTSRSSASSSSQRSKLLARRCPASALATRPSCSSVGALLGELAGPARAGRPAAARPPRRAPRRPRPTGSDRRPHRPAGGVRPASVNSATIASWARTVVVVRLGRPPRRPRPGRPAGDRRSAAAQSTRVAQAAARSSRSAGGGANRPTASRAASKDAPGRPLLLVGDGDRALGACAAASRAARTAAPALSSRFCSAGQLGQPAAAARPRPGESASAAFTSASRDMCCSCWARLRSRPRSSSRATASRCLNATVGDVGRRPGRLAGLLGGLHRRTRAASAGTVATGCSQTGQSSPARQVHPQRGRPVQRSAPRRSPAGPAPAAARRRRARPRPGRPRPRASLYSTSATETVAGQPLGLAGQPVALGVAVQQQAAASRVAGRGQLAAHLLLALLGRAHRLAAPRSAAARAAATASATSALPAGGRTRRQHRQLGVQRVAGRGQLGLAVPGAAQRRHRLLDRGGQLAHRASSCCSAASTASSSASARPASSWSMVASCASALVARVEARACTSS